MTAPLLRVTGLRKRFVRDGRIMAALDGVGFEINGGETLALVGPSGSGKSTLARLILRLTPPDGGEVWYDGRDLLQTSRRELRAMRRHLQMVFQDTLTAFNPRATVARVLTDPLRVHELVPRAARGRTVAGLLERVGLSPALHDRAIHEISGGQRQRVAIARALATKPSLIVLDEAVSALDVSVRGEILELLRNLQRDENIAYLFISHDLGVVRALAHRVAILDAGRIVETGDAHDVIAAPSSVIGRALVAATPKLLGESAKEV